MAHAVRLEAVGAPDPLDGTEASPAAFAIKAPVQWVVSPGGSPSVRATTRSAASAPSGLMREGRVLLRSKPSNASSTKRSCQRQTQVLDLPVRRVISFAPTPSAVKSTISARQTCFCGALRSRMRALSRRTSADETESDFPARIAQTLTSRKRPESRAGHKCQVRSTRAFANVGSALRVAMAYETVFDSPHFGHQIWVTGAFAGQRA
jgi:hypothetical protein